MTRDADWLSVDDARETVLGAVRALPAERRALLDALGRVLAEAVESPLDLPPWDNSAMDGFAVRSEDVRGASAESPVTLRVVDDIAAGAAPSTPIRAGEAARIMTGAPVPDGADGVIRIEHTDGGAALGTADACVSIVSDHDAGTNIRRRGEDLTRGSRVLAAGTVLRSAELGVLASLGRSQVTVTRRPRVAVLASGDELADVDGFADVLAGRKIVSTNSYTIAAQLHESGFEPRLLGIAPDSPDGLREHLERARGCDALVTTGGISVGVHDHTRAVLDEFGLETAFWRVRMRPGSPFAFGRVGALGEIPWFGLPGNPVSSMVTFEVFARPALRRMAGHTAIEPRVVRARLDEDHSAKPGLTHFVRVRLRPDGAGGWRASLTGAQGSGILTSMAKADGLMVLREGETDVKAGERRPVMRLDCDSYVNSIR